VTGVRAGIVAAVLATLFVAVAPVAADAPNPGASLAQLRQDVGGRGAAASPLRYAYLEKLDSHLQAVAASRLGAGSVASARLAARRQSVTISPAADVLVDVYVRGDLRRSADDLRALGMRVSAVSSRAPQRLVEGYLPAAALPGAAALDSTQAILTTLSRVNAGSVMSQGDGAINGPAARAPLGVGAAGAGVSVGIISDSIDQLPTPGAGIASSVGTGDLPPNTVALSDSAGGTDEGRAMAEIVYDEAPNLSGIYFETANGGPAAKASAIDDLVAHGVKVIADDTTYLTEPFFQDDVVAQAVDRAKAAGVAYFASAGNDSRNAWEGTFTPAPSSTSEDFDPGPGVDTMQAVATVPANVEVDVVLQWAEPWGHAATNLDLEIYDLTGGTPTLVASSTSDNALTGMPVEFAGAVAGSAPATVGIVIRRVSGAATPFMKYIAYVNGPRLTMEHPSIAGSIGPDAASASGALTVAASDYHTPQTPEAFSSRGPVTHFFDASSNPLASPTVRQKPELAAPDNVDTTVTGFTGFQGTSAAAPAAAGIAALIRSAKPSMAIDELYAIMTTPANALDCTLSAAVPDPDCGAGFTLADRAMAMALDPTPPVVAPVVTPAVPDGANGWYRGPVTVTWSASDPESPVVDPAGCGEASPGDGTSVLTCSATSAGGTTSAPLTIKRDSTAPSAPAITGIGAKTYLPATLPKASAVHCTAADPTSGIAGCTVTGYGTAFGAHTLTATATNAAGLTTTTTLRFTVAKPVAIAHLRLANVKLARLRSSGLTLTIRVAAASTRVVVKLVATVPKAASTGTRSLTIGTLTRRNVGAGTHRFRIALTQAGKLALSTLARANLKVTVGGSSARAKAASLKGSLVVRR
jgi:hypothetical protein